MILKWKKRTGILVVTAAIISITIVACIFIIPSIRKKLERNGKFDFLTEYPAYPFTSGGVCASEDCVVSAARILKYMDPKVDPCEDFYNFSCGKFLLSHSIPDSWDSYGTSDIYDEELDLTVKSVLEEGKRENQSDALHKAKTVYATCMDTAHIDRFGVQDLKDVLSSTGVGDWPFLNADWKDCRLDIEWRMAKLNAMGLDSLFHLETRFGGEEHRLHAVLTPAEPLVADICDDDPDNVTVALERAAVHREILETVLKLLDVDVNNVTEIDIDDLFEFDFLFCNATKELRQKGPTSDVDSLNMTLFKLADMAPLINWVRWRNLIFTDLRLDFPHDKQHILIDGMEPVIHGINELLHKTTSKVQANYLTWRFVLQHLGFLGRDFRQIVESRARTLGPKMGPLLMGSDRGLPRWRQCVLYAKHLMPLAILRPYSEHMQMQSREEEMDSVISLVTDEFKLIMKDTQLLKKADQMRSTHKLGLIQFLLTYPYKDKKFFNNYYLDVGILTESFLKNGLKLRLSRMRKLLEGVSRGKTLYDMEYTIQTIYSPFVSETYSFFKGNQIVISLGALQTCPEKNKPIPKFMTLSTFGFKIGHELAHGFDLFALDGSTGQNWTSWSPSFTATAKYKAHCYLRYLPSGFNLTVEEALKTTTLNEDICDNQAILLAHRAYLRHLYHPYEDQTLPGIPLSNRELFFVTYAQQFCELRRPGSLTPSTATGRRRVNQVLQNYAPFAATFGCARNRPMNQPKCESLWI